MTAIANLPDIRPSLLLDFANSGRVDPRIQCTRASSATCCGPDGKLRTVAANVPRIDYDPVTGKCLGLLVEEARTNTGTPPIASGSVPQVPTYTYNADLPPLVVGRVPVRNYAVGAVDATSAAGDRANIRANPPGLTENTTYTASIYVCGVAGGATRATLYFALSGVPTSQVTIDLVVGRWQRLVATFTLPAGVSGTGALRVAGSGGADPLQPFGVDGYQFEVGASASSYIPTEASAVTRAADVVKIVAGLNKERFSIQVVGTQASLTSMTPVSVYSAPDNSNVRLVSMSTGRARIETTVAGTNVNLSATQSAVTSDLRRNFVASYDGLAASLSLNGLQAMSAPSTVSLSDAEILLGRAGPTSTLSLFSGQLERVALYPSALSGAQLQSMSRL